MSFCAFAQLVPTSIFFSSWDKSCVKFNTENEDHSKASSKAIKIRYPQIDCHSVKIHWLSEVFWGAIIWNFDIKLTDGTTLSAYLSRRRFQLDHWGKLREKDEKWIGLVQGIEPQSMGWEFRVLTTRPQIRMFRDLNFSKNRQWIAFFRAY